MSPGGKGPGWDGWTLLPCVCPSCGHPQTWSSAPPSPYWAPQGGIRSSSTAGLLVEDRVPGAVGQRRASDHAPEAPDPEQYALPRLPGQGPHWA